MILKDLRVMLAVAACLSHLVLVSGILFTYYCKLIDGIEMKEFVVYYADVTLAIKDVI